MQKLWIKHLGPISQLEFEIKDFNLIIGEQATGKSTVAKCVFFFRNIKDTIIDYLCQIYDTGLYNGSIPHKDISSTLKSELKSIFISIFGYSWDLNDNLYLKYEYTADVWIDVKLNQSKENKHRKYISVRYSSKLKEELTNIEKVVKALPKEESFLSLAFASNTRKRVLSEIKLNVNKIFNDEKETYYIPAGRCLLTLLSNQKSTIDYQNLDYITTKYMQIIESIHPAFADGIEGVYKRYPDDSRKFDVHEIASFLIESLKGDYYYSQGNEKLVLTKDTGDSVSVKINFASSGQQEVLWLLNELFVLLMRGEESFVIIEEPEAHLYPVLQKRIMDFIAFFVKINNSSVLVTTHSPYVLTSANALYSAGNLVYEHPELQKQVLKMLELRAAIDPNSFNALKLKTDNVIEYLVDNELNELRTELIDEISEKINELYVDLFYLREELTSEE